MGIGRIVKKITTVVKEESHIIFFIFVSLLTTLTSCSRLSANDPSYDFEPTLSPSPGVNTWYFHNDMESLRGKMGSRYLIPEYLPEAIMTDNLLLKSQFIDVERLDSSSTDNLVQYSILYDEQYNEKNASLSADEVRIIYLSIETLDDSHTKERLLWPPLGGYIKAPDDAETSIVIIRNCSVSISWVYNWRTPFILIADFTFDSIPYNLSIGTMMGSDVEESDLIELIMQEIKKILESMLPKN